MQNTLSNKSIEVKNNVENKPLLTKNQIKSTIKILAISNLTLVAFMTKLDIPILVYLATTKCLLATELISGSGIQCWHIVALVTGAAIPKFIPSKEDKK